MEFRASLRLIACRGCVESSFAPADTPVTIHRFEQTIGGRAYTIEVTPVSNQWRAQLQRGTGGPTAMMPFYGQTPDEAADLLTRWLTLAYRRSAPAAAAS